MILKFLEKILNTTDSFNTSPFFTNMLEYRDIWALPKLPICPPGNTNYKIKYPSTFSIFLLLSALSLIFSIVILVKFNHVKVFNRYIYIVLLVIN